MLRGGGRRRSVRVCLAWLPEIEAASQDVDFARCRFGDLQIDVLLTRNPLFAAVARQRVSRRPFAEREIPCATG